MYFNAKEFGKRLQSARKMRGLTQVELAERLGLSSSQHISKIERGEKTCSIDLLVELSCVLHVSTEYLLKGVDADREQVKNELQSIVTQLTRITKEL
ncbi:MAG: helix-turn-helix domain-containing protein [Clostridiales bacterium]|nr:helix-turn-helix domain-containing protein [Clostridiales bacterium]